MSATPIPRTLALTLYGDLDVTTIDEPPPGRTPVRTRIVDRSRWDDLLGFIAGRLRAGDQALFVYPRIEGEAGGPRDATRMASEISAHPSFSGLRVALVHGKLPARERGGILDEMRSGRIHALVATTVVEVGLDLPRATILVVEHPERYGLAQLHQLRGRVGRAPGADPYLFLIRPEGGAGLDRLRFLARETDGLRIAEEDLRLRGPGELLGPRQAGLPPFRAADLAADRDLLDEGRRLADRIVREDPDLVGPVHRRLWSEAVRRHPEGGRLFAVD